MKNRLILIVLLNLFLCHLCSAQLYLSEKKVRKHKISKQIRHYVEENYKGNSVKYFKIKTHQDSVLYEAKVKTDQGKVTLFFNTSSQFIGMTSEVHYLSISEESRNRMNQHLMEKLSDYKLTNCRDQIVGGEKIYELDISTRKSKYKFTFKEDGTFIEYHEVPQKAIDLIFN